jgi:C1A family cysteine protease
LFYCYARNQGRNCDNGWWVAGALNAFRKHGVVDNACFTYTAGDQPCNLCTDSNLHTNKVTNWHIIKSTSAMKESIVNRGPLITCFAVYTDLYAYKSGIYRTTYDVFGSNPGVEFEGGHCVCCVGYDDIAKCWICKNSWGSSWGDNGYFRIRYGDCGIDNDMFAIDGIYSLSSLNELLKARRFSFSASVRNLAQDRSLIPPISVRQLMDELG